MVSQALGRLVRVEVRNAWASEAQHFTPWLAQEENIALLGETIGLELEVEAQEASVGPFRADILCRDTLTGHYVLIENQLERTDHLHLGQLMTYAAGLDAVNIVWIATPFTEEHRAALDWLNRITNETINFFGLEVELWRIGESAPAPKFNIVSKPNDWQKTAAAAAAGAASTAPTQFQQLHLDFWTQFREFMEQRKSLVQIGKPTRDHWKNVSLGRSYFVLSAWNGMRDSRSGIELVISGPEAKRYFFALRDGFQRQIESQLGELQWRELPENKESHVSFVRPSKPTDPSTWPELDKWMGDTLENWVRVLRPIIQTLQPATTEDAATAPTSEDGAG